MNLLRSRGPEPKAVLICGPTASGKSSLAMRIAEERHGIVINADAMQVYSSWRILTARPTAEDEARLPHALYGHVGGHEAYSAGTWLRDVRRILGEEPGRLPVIVGGTGLYFFALTNGLAPVPDIPDGIRGESRRLRDQGEIDRMIRDLRRASPDSVDGLELENPARVARAWEVQMATGRSLSHWHAQRAEPVLQLKDVEPLLLWPEPDETASSIDRRLKRMVADGVVDECRQALQGWDHSLPCYKALGASEFRDHLEGRIGLDETLRRVAAATRRFAKRQRTWFRSRMGGWRRVSPDLHPV